MPNTGVIEFVKTIEVKFDDPKKAASANYSDGIDELSVHIALAYKNQPRQTLGDAVDGFLDLGDKGRYKLMGNGEYVSVGDFQEKYGTVRIKHTTDAMRSRVEFRG